MDDFARILVGERDVAELDFLPDAFETLRVRLVGDFAAGVDYREYAFTRRNTLIDVGELVDERTGLDA